MDAGLVGKWTVKFKSWTWEYTFTADGRVTWRDPLNGETGTGRVGFAQKVIFFTWAGSTEKESWNLPISNSMKGWVDASYGIGPLSAFKKVGVGPVVPPGPTPPPPPPPPDLISSTTFEIRVVGGLSGSALAQADNYIFQIVDLTRRKTAFYHYTGVGLGLSIPKIPGPGSVTKVGPPTKFQTSRSVELYQFNAAANLLQMPGATLGSLSVWGTLKLTFGEIKNAYPQYASDIYVMIIPMTISIEGGSGIQMPGLGSSTWGVLALQGQVYPFSGY